MNEYRIKWQRCPHIYNPCRVSFVQADNADDAEAVLRDHIARKEGFDWFTIHELELAVAPPAGKVL